MCSLVALKNSGAIMLVVNWVSRAMTDAAMMQTESGLAVVMAKVKGETGAILTDPKNISVKNMTSGNDVPVADLLNASTGAFNATQGATYTEYGYDEEGNIAIEIGEEKVAFKPDEVAKIATYYDFGKN